MSLTPRLTLIGLYKYSSSLFDNLILPDGIDRETFIDTLLMEYGECPLCSPDYDYMVLAIGAWSRKNYDNIERIKTALTEKYNPIHNYDRTETWSENEKTKNEYTLDRKQDNETTSNETTENTVSAYNEDTYQPDTKTTVDATGTFNGEDNNTYNGSGERGNNKIGHAYGNIGVTTSQKMVDEELNLRINNNLFHIIAQMFYKDFCLYIF